MKKILFELSINDASTIVSYIDQIIENGVSLKDKQPFINLKASLRKPIFIKSTFK